MRRIKLIVIIKINNSYMIWGAKALRAISLEKGGKR